MQLELFDHVQVAMQLDVIYRVQRESARGWTTVEERSMRSPPMAQTLQVRAKGCVFEGNSARRSGGAGTIVSLDGLERI